MTAEELFWDLVEPMYADPAVQRSTMMGLPCVRLDGRFFASLDRRSGALLVKLPVHRVRQLIDAGHGQLVAPAGRAFREWVAITAPLAAPAHRGPRPRRAAPVRIACDRFRRSAALPGDQASAMAW
jgi:hypothetical protein